MFIINAVSVINEQMFSELPVTQDHRDYMAQQGRGSSIIGPNGEILAGPMGPEEGILYADVERDTLVSPKIVQDFAGHYNRFDLLSLSITRHAPPALRLSEVPFRGETESGPAAEIVDLSVREAVSPPPRLGDHSTRPREIAQDWSAERVR